MADPPSFLLQFLDDKAIGNAHQEPVCPPTHNKLRFLVGAWIIEIIPCHSDDAFLDHLGHLICNLQFPNYWELDSKALVHVPLDFYNSENILYGTAEWVHGMGSLKI